jgi:Tfp pilus assembly protein PilX
MKRAPQKGIALILTLILLFVMSVMAVSLMFVSQTETWSSLNYRLMSQARDGAEAGVNSASNYIMNTYTEPAAGGSDPISAYNVLVTPVTAGGSPVILTTLSGHTSNYPASSVPTAFSTYGAGTGSITAGNTTINYNTEATLLSMTSLFTPYGTTTPRTVQTWKILSEGAISTIRNAKVQVSATLEQYRMPVFDYAAFATDPSCSALQFGGGGTTDSYDSNTVSGGTVTTQAYGGNVGTNGNLGTSGNPTTINGTLSTPRTGVGTCTSGGVTAWSGQSGTVTGGLVQLPQTVNYPLPVIPPPGTTNLSITQSTTCAVLGLASPPCASSGTDIYIPPGNYGDIAISGNETVHFSPGVYNINTIREQSAQSGLVIDEYPCVYPCLSSIDPYVGTSSTLGSVILNVTGNGGGTVVNLTGNSVQNPSLNPDYFQILYAGTGTISLKGGTYASGLVYAPLASFSFAGGSDWYGAVIGADMTDMGGTHIHYDRRLQNKDFMVGPWMLSSFTWKKY